MNQALLSSATGEWETPRAFFDALDAEFGFTLDAAATTENAKCPRFYTKADNGLAQPWGGVVWLNPPYGYGIGKWIQKCHEEAQGGATVVALIPARTDTAWWHDHVMKSEEIRLVRGRLYFSGAKVNAPFPNAVVIWRPGVHAPRFTVMDRLLDPGAVRDHTPASRAAAGTAPDQLALFAELTA